MNDSRMTRREFHKAASLVAAGAVSGLAGKALAAQAKAQPKKIVFIAGPKDHGGPITHTYEKDLLLLKKCIDESGKLKGVTTKIYTGKAPKDINELRDAATIVVHSSGDGIAKETHALFPVHNKVSEADAKYLKELDGLMKGGLGIVVLHYSLIVRNPRSRAYLLDWIGGYHKSGKSKVKIDTSKAEPAKPGHPILNGVRPWTTRHEYYYNQHFDKDDKRVVPILTSMLPSSDPKRHVIAWAVQREGGGRGFAFTGGHFYKNMLVDGYRRMLLNGILWTAKIPVPTEGLSADITEKDLDLPPEKKPATS